MISPFSNTIVNELLMVSVLDWSLSLLIRLVFVMFIVIVILVFVIYVVVVGLVWL